MSTHRIVSPTEWLTARQELLAREKAFNQARDALSQARRELPWTRVDKNYVFTGPAGPLTLGELFDGRRQLLVYHFMFGADWEAGCKSCSFWADNYSGAIAHIRQRDANLVTVSRAPLEKIEAFRQRMGWSFPWVSSFGSDFNRDFHVSFTPEEIASGKVYYNYRETAPFSSEGPGISVFFRDDDGSIYHTYSTYARGLDMLNGAYHWIDLLPRGRDEAGLASPQAWVKHHDKYA